jgi:hypothetical protein
MIKRPRIVCVLGTAAKEARMLDERLLGEVMLWSWVVYVLWATQRSWE